MSDSTFANWMQKGNIPASNVLTINSVWDFPHWSDLKAIRGDFLRGLTLASGNVSLSLSFAVSSNLDSFWHGYDYNRSVGTHMFIYNSSVDEHTGRKNLGHGCMYDGIVNSKIFRATINNVRSFDGTILDYINIFLNERRYK